MTSKSQISDTLATLFSAGSSQDPLEIPAHHLFVASIVTAMATKYKEDAIKQLSEAKADEVSNAVANTVSIDKGGEYDICLTPTYQVMLNTRKGSSSVDKTALLNKLMVDLDMSKEEADDFVASVSKTSQPAKTWKVEKL